MQQQIRASRPFDAYKKQGVLTASPIELIIMLYDGLKKNLVLAKRAIAKGENEAAHNSLIKSQDIISELINSLDLSFSLSKDLMSIYEFLLTKLAEINAAKDAAAIDGLVEIVDDLRDTWKQVAAMQKGTLDFNNAMQMPQGVLSVADE